MIRFAMRPNVRSTSAGAVAAASTDDGMPATRSSASVPWGIFIDVSPLNSICARIQTTYPLSSMEEHPQLQTLLHLFRGAGPLFKPLTHRGQNLVVVLAKGWRRNDVQRPLIIKSHWRAHGPEPPHHRMLGFYKQLEVFRLRVFQCLACVVHRRVGDIINLEAPAPFFTGA